MSGSNPDRRPSEFPPTRWSCVVQAAGRPTPDARTALADLCAAYWYPIYAFVRRKGNDPERSLDLTQGYFARLLEKGVLAAADRSKGRFRAFLLADCGHFLIDQHRREIAEMRRGEAVRLSIDARDAEGRYRFEPLDPITPDRQFDRAWALTLLGHVLEALESEYEEAGKADLFMHLKAVLTEGKGAVPAAALAERLGMTEGAVHVAVHRLRKRYRAILRGRIAATLDDPSEAEVEDEIRSLFEALRTRRGESV